MELSNHKMKIFKASKAVFGEIGIFAIIFAVIFVLYDFFGVFLEACF